jgi:hypothetical protein
MSDSPNLGITYLEEGQAKAEITVNEALNILDAVVCCWVKDRGLGTPPASPSDGDRYIVPSGASGSWSGYENYIAAYYSGWIFVAPVEGMRARVDDEGGDVVYTGSAWAKAGPVAELTQSISASPTQGEVENIQDTVNAIIQALEATGALATS